MGIDFGIMNITTADVGWFLVIFTLLTLVYMIGCFRGSWTLSLLFFTLLLGFIFLDISHLGGPAIFTKVAGADLIVCALTALYSMAETVLGQFGYKLPDGKGWLAK